MIVTNDEIEPERIKSQIISILKSHPEGLTIKELSESINLHRQTVTKYIFELKGAEKIWRRRVGSATLHYIEKSENHGRTK